MVKKVLSVTTTTVKPTTSCDPRKIIPHFFLLLISPTKGKLIYWQGGGY